MDTPSPSSGWLRGGHGPRVGLGKWKCLLGGTQSKVSMLQRRQEEVPLLQDCVVSGCDA